MIINKIPIQKVDIWLDDYTFEKLIEDQDLFIFEINDSKLVLYNGFMIGYNSAGDKYV